MGARFELLEARRMLAAYFFSSSAAGPVDGSALYPFRTLAAMPTLASGDAFYFKAGDTFTGSLKTFDGVSDIVVASYARTKTAKRAIIRSGSNAGAQFKDCDNVVVANLKFIGTNPAANHADGINFSATTLGRHAKILVDRSVLSGYGGAGIAFRSNGSRSAGFDFVTVRDCSISEGGDFGILVGDGAIDQPYGQNGLPIDGGTYSHKHVTIEGCIATSIHGYGPGAPAGSGILIAETRFAMIDRCQAYNNGEANTGASGPSGIWLISTSQGTIQNCVSHDNIKTLLPPDGGIFDGCGFDLDNNCVFCTMQYNHSYNNGGAGFFVFDIGDDVNVRGKDYNAFNVVRYNISENDGRMNEAGIMVSGRIRNCKIYNNTVYITPSRLDTQTPLPPAFWIRGKKYAGIEVRNNIFFSTGDGQRTARIENPNLDPSLTTDALIYVTLDYNDYFNPHSPGQKTIFYLDLNTSSKVHTLNDLRKDIRGAQEIHGTVEEPKFGEGYRLLPDSPMIDRGQVIGNGEFGSFAARVSNARDFFGNIIPQGEGYDIGAAEFVVS